MKHVGDITKLSGYTLPAVDIITGGSPCQDLSVAGKRAGLAGERSGLFMEQIRIVKEMRDNDIRNGADPEDARPRYMVWENVPGAFSSNGGKDFQAVLTEIARVAEPDAPDVPLPEKGKWSKAGCLYGAMGEWSVAWRVHDAQFWGVPQRRKRISLVADFGGLSAPEILFEREGLSGDPEPCGEAGQETAGAAGGGVEGASKCLNPWDVQSKHIQPPNGVAEALYSGECRYGGGESYVMQGNGASGVVTKGNGECFLTEEKHMSLSTGGGQAGQGYPCVLQANEPILLESNQNHATVQTDGISTALPASMGMGGGYVPMVTAYGISSYDSNAMKSPNPHSGIYEADTARTLDLNGGSPACNQGGIAVVQPSYCLQGNGIGRSDNAGCNGKGWTEEVSYTLNTIDRPAVYDARGNGDGKTVCTITGDHQNRVTDYTALCVGNGQLNQMSMAEQANTLDTMHDQQAVMVAPVYSSTVGSYMTASEEVAQTLMARDYKDPQIVNPPHHIVRRLTPLECERLQGYPDGWTDIGEWVDSNGKKHKDADSPRYKALGNSIALPFWQWMFGRIVEQYPAERRDKLTLGSLFDGIGGFPLTAQRNGIEPVWASEIEEFPIAVTKARFPDESV